MKDGTQYAIMAIMYLMLFGKYSFLAYQWSWKPKTKNMSQQLTFLKAPRLQGGRGILRFFWYGIDSLQKTQGKNPEKIPMSTRLEGNQYFRCRLTGFPWNMVPTQAPVSGFRPWLAGMTTWLKGGRVISKNVKNQNSNNRRISDSPIISIVSKLKRHESRSSRLPPLSGPISKSIPKVPI